MSGARPRWRAWGLALRRYLTFFLTMAFLITCCMTLFISQLQTTLGFAFTQQQLSRAARLTFGNVLLLSLLCTVVDEVRRRFLVDRPVRQIVQAARRITRGDFSVRIPPLGILGEDGFAVIANSFNTLAQELAGMETLRTDFIANVSHELKTPLAVLQNYGTLLQQPALPEQTRLEYARAVTDTSRRLASLVTNILKLNKLENQQIYPAAATYDLGEQLCACLLGFEEAWEAKDLEVETDLQDGVFVHTDSELLSLVWNNLFSNAIKFTAPGGRIGLTLRARGADAVVEVSDTGCGISPEVGRHIFEKFYQGDTSHATQGNGLGLALVRRVVDIVGGSITVHSEVGRGSRFTVMLRRETDEKADRTQPPSA